MTKYFLTASALIVFAHAITQAVEAPPSPRLLLEQPVSEYKARRLTLMKRVREAESLKALFQGASDDLKRAKSPRPAEVVIVLVGETEEPEDARFHQSNMFAYLTGVETPHAALILLPAENQEILYLPKRDPDEERWTGPKLAHDVNVAEQSGFDRVEPISAFLGDLLTAVGDPGKRTFGSPSATIYLLSPSPKPATGGPAAGLSRLLREAAPSTRYKDVAPMIGDLRTVKSSNEVTLIRKAIALTADAQSAAGRLIAPDVPEFRAEGAILAAFVGGGGTRAGFPSIVGSGPNSTVLHYNTNRRIMREGELVVVDIGAEYAYYSADITRTFPVSGKFTRRQREIYQLVLDCQTKVEQSYEKGKTSLTSQSGAAHEYLRESPLRAKDEQGVERSMDHFFTHGLGHYLGMDVHDVGNTGKPLPIGAVFTIEPGIYIPSEGFGVRIEDDYLVTETGLEKLSAAIPSKVDEIENLAKIVTHKTTLIKEPIFR